MLTLTTAPRMTVADMLALAEIRFPVGTRIRFNSTQSVLTVTGVAMRRVWRDGGVHSIPHVLFGRGAGCEPVDVLWAEVLDLNLDTRIVD